MGNDTFAQHPHPHVHLFQATRPCPPRLRHARPTSASASTIIRVRYERFVLNTHGLSEDEAYQRLRAKAMVNREVIEEVAQAIVKAHDVLSL